MAAGPQPPQWLVHEVQQRLVLFLNHVLMQEREAMDRLVRQKGRVARVQWRVYSLALVVVYSVLDLTWTILAHQAGQMLELNPLGSHLIENPLHLVVFKAGATGLAVGLLFVLRKYRRAQLAAWWVCLVCTLLTARWLTISPMMAA